MKEYLEQAIALMCLTGHLSYNFNSFSKIYSMTTENIYGFLRNYDLKDKKILTVAGSGDQRLNAYFMGAKEVTCFDINPLSLLQLKLKDSAINTINFEKFVKFFGIYSHRYSDYYQALDSRIFEEFKQFIDDDTFYFFNYIINECQNFDFKDIYFYFENNLNLLQKINNFLDPSNYITLRKIIENKDIPFINSDVDNLSKELNGEKYDMILLSNISDYMYDLSKYREVIDNLIDNLNMYGILQVGYIYSIYDKNGKYSDFKDDEKRKKYFPTSLFHSVMVDSYYGGNKKDKVITYQRLR